MEIVKNFYDIAGFIFSTVQKVSSPVGALSQVSSSAAITLIGTEKSLKEMYLKINFRTNYRHILVAN